MPCKSLVINSFSSCLSERVLILLSLLMDIFTRYRIQDWIFFFPRDLKKKKKVISLFPGSHHFCWKIRHHFYCCSFENIVSILSSCFQVFFFSKSSNLIRRHLKVTCLHVSILGFTGLLELLGWDLYQVGEFWVMMSSNFVSLILPLLSLWNSNSQEIKRFDHASHVLGTLFYSILICASFKCFSADLSLNPLILFSTVSRFFLDSYIGFLNIVYCILS